jgi:hypothetical protein
MTAHKHLKQLVRARMQKTGEGYASARRHIIRLAPRAEREPALRWHFPGNVPAATALRVLLAHAGVRAPHTRQPFSEAMVFGIAGGIGIGLCSFFYKKEDFASFYIAGRHLWLDDSVYLKTACQRFGLGSAVRETSGAKTALEQLREALSDGPCIAWVDMAHLPHRALPAIWSGGGYHVITIYRLDDENQTALIGDLTDEPITIALADLAQARERIKKQKHRLLSIPAGLATPDTPSMIREGLRACHDGLTKQRMKWFTLESIRIWGERMHGSSDKESWDRVFASGANLWRGLTSIHDFIEHYGTGGGLCRPLFAEFLREAAEVWPEKRLASLADQYTELGRAWSDLASAALPKGVPLFDKARELFARRNERMAGGDSVDAVRETWNQLEGLAAQAKAKFPLSPTESAELRRGLKQRILQLYAGEIDAHAALTKVVA